MTGSGSHGFQALSGQTLDLFAKVVTAGSVVEDEAELQVAVDVTNMGGDSMFRTEKERTLATSERLRYELRVQSHRETVIGTESREQDRKETLGLEVPMRRSI